MRVSVEENRMVVVTDISKSCIEKGYTDLTARDEKGNELYKICVNTEGNGELETLNIECEAQGDNIIFTGSKIDIDELYNRNAKGDPISWGIHEYGQNNEYIVNYGVVGGHKHSEIIKAKLSRGNEIESRIKAKRKED